MGERMKFSDFKTLVQGLPDSYDDFEVYIQNGDFLRTIDSNSPIRIERTHDYAIVNGKWDVVNNREVIVISDGNDI